MRKGGKMATKFKKIPTKVMLWSTIIYLGALYFMQSFFDIQSFVVYIVVGVLTAEIAASQIFKWNTKKIAILGASVPVIYHLIGIAMNEFTATIQFITLTAFWQAVFTVVVYKVWGGKR